MFLYFDRELATFVDFQVGFQIYMGIKTYNNIRVHSFANGLLKGVNKVTAV